MTLWTREAGKPNATLLYHFPSIPDLKSCQTQSLPPLKIPRNFSQFIGITTLLLDNLPCDVVAMSGEWKKIREALQAGDGINYQILQKKKTPFNSRTSPFYTKNISPLPYGGRNPTIVCRAHRNFVACCQHNGHFKVWGCPELVGMRGRVKWLAQYGCHAFFM